MDEIKKTIEPETTPAEPVGGVTTHVDDLNTVVDGTTTSTVKTYVTDITKAIEGNRGAIVKKMIEEQEEYKNSGKVRSPHAPRGRIYALLAILFFILAIGTIVMFYLNKEDANTVHVAPQYKPLVFTDHVESIELKNLSKDDITKKVFDLVKNTTVKIGGVEGIYPKLNEKIIGFNTFMNLMGSTISFNTSGAVRDNFLLGAVHYSNVGLVNTKSSSTDSIVTPAPPAEPTVIEGKLISLNSSVFFKTGTVTFIDATAKDTAKKAINDFLDGIDFTTTKISVVGTYSVEKPSKQNDALAEQRRKIGVDILNEVLTAKYTAEDMKKIIVESSAKGVSIHDTHTPAEIKAMTPALLNDEIVSTQGIQYFAQAKTKSTTVSAPVLDNTTTEIVTETDTSKVLASEDTDFFMLLSIRSFADVFDIMHTWETSMFNDLHGFLGVTITPDNEYLLTKSFENGIIQNRNARILYDNNGNIALMYVYADDASIVITRTENVTREIILRLAASQIKK